MVTPYSATQPLLGRGRRRVKRVSATILLLDIVQLFDQVGDLAGGQAVGRVFLDGLRLQHRFDEGDALRNFSFEDRQRQFQLARLRHRLS